MTGPATLLRIEAASVVAPAKINLALHVTGRREDGYHSLSSLVAFTEYGDSLSVGPSKSDTFAIGGRFASMLGGPGDGENIVLKALAGARGLAARHGMAVGPIAMALHKHLPVAAGIGGGSADAAALLRIIASTCPEMASDLRMMAVELGADVPMCLDGVPALVEGVGEITAPLRRFPAAPCLLVNPGVPVATSEVFAKLRSIDSDPLPSIAEEGFATTAALVGYLEATRNDLSLPAETIAPEIATARDELQRHGALLSRMSGSGATVFGLYEMDAAAKEAASALAALHPQWWIVATRLTPCGDGT